MKNQKQTIGPIRLYRADLIQKAKEAADDSFAFLAKVTGLSKQTIQDVVNGNAAKLDAIFVIARHYHIDWLELFDVDRRLVYGRSGDAVSVKARKRNALIHA